DYLFLQQDIILGKRVTKGGSAFIPTLKGGVFPLRPLHPRKINSPHFSGILRTSGTSCQVTRFFQRITGSADFLRLNEDTSVRFICRAYGCLIASSIEFLVKEGRTVEIEQGFSISEFLGSPGVSGNNPVPGEFVS
ncbi:MAG: hypothetical protein WBH70_00780, partial [Candidatus Methanoculleus thermohydrogenotrophicum]